MTIHSPLNSITTPSAPKASRVKLGKQKTLKSSINCVGIALHSGAKVAMTLRPAEVNTGIVFKRVDIVGGGSLIPARWDHVVDTRLNTTLGNSNGVTISTVEHLMAALSGCDIDNALIEINGPEVPIMDGSAAPFVFLIECAGILSQKADRRAIRINKAISLSYDGKTVELTPSQDFSLQFEIDFDDTVVANQKMSVGIANGVFKNDISRARTFGFMHEVEQLRAAGLAKGGSPDNAIVISGDKVLNEGGLRFDDEFVRHKILDAVGDLYLAGAPIMGHFKGICSGHAMNNELLRSLFADESAWSYTTADALNKEGFVYSSLEAATDKNKQVAFA
ncbi:MAG: UDP-3-O-acyl-N-acetylglucosamine deacetylase [Rhodospirillales bacterium]|nr:UDP-3-O-acyl-N-acetylglucosamine deacetylase [Rhodospirillales bacterium]